MSKYRPYLYTKGADAGVDEEWKAAPSFGKVRPGSRHLFWKSGFRWYCVSLEGVRRIYRRVEMSQGRLCAGGHTTYFEWLVLELPGGEELVVHIVDNIDGGTKAAEKLLDYLKETHPQIPYGKV